MLLHQRTPTLLGDCCISRILFWDDQASKSSFYTLFCIGAIIALQLPLFLLAKTAGWDSPTMSSIVIGRRIKSKHILRMTMFNRQRDIAQSKSWSASDDIDRARCPRCVCYLHVLAAPECAVSTCSQTSRIIDRGSTPARARQAKC